MQRAKTETMQRLDGSPGGDDKTEKWLAGDDGAARTVVDAGMRMRDGKPQNIIVDSNTRLAVSHLFDSSAALERLTEPEKKDYARLIASPRAANFLVQMWRDLEMRILVGLILAGTIAGILIAAY